MNFSIISFFFIFISASQATQFHPLPKMIVFDLDQVLWPFWIDSTALPPFHKNSSGHILDYENDIVVYNNGVPEVFKYLRDNNIYMSVCANTYHANGTRQLLDLFGWTKYFKTIILQDYGQKSVINKVSEETKIKLEDMIYFFHELKMIPQSEVDKICTHKVSRGMCMSSLYKGLKKYADEHKERSSS